jgi:hypothetical protein
MSSGPGALTWRAQAAAPSRGGILRWVIFGVIAVVAIVALRQATMNRPDAPRIERTSTVEVSVRTNGSRLALEDAAGVLWAACASTVDAYDLVALDQVGRQLFALRLEPALGDHAQRRLLGCLEDTTVPRILGEVTRVEHR